MKNEKLNSPEAALLRHQKDESLRMKYSEKIMSLTKVNALKLLHSLEVHKIELELQNEELRLARDQAEKATQKFTELYDLAPTGYFTLEFDGTITELNLSGAKMLGIERAELVKSNFRLFITQDTLPLFNYFLKKAFETGEKQICEVRLINTGIPSIFIYIEGITSNTGQTCFISIVDITDRKQSEENLSKSEERFRLTLDTMLEGCQIIGFDWRYLYLNESAAVNGRVKKQDLIGQTMMEIFPGIVETEMFGRLEKCMSKRTNDHMVNEFTFPDGSSGWFELSIQAVPEGIFIISFDITESRLVKESLIESEAKFRNLFEHSPLGKSITGTGGSMEVNNAFCKIVGYTLEELKEMKWMDITFPEDLPLTTGFVNSCMEGKIAQASFEKRYIHKNGSIVWADVSSYLQRDRYNKPEFFITTIADITERKLTEEALLKVHEQMVLSQQSAGTGFWDWDMLTDELDWSPEMFRLFGLDPSITRASFEVWLRVIHQDDRAEVQDKLQASIQNHTQLQNEYRIILPSGEFRWIGALGDTTYDTDGGPQRMNGICLDITERKKREVELKESEYFFRETQRAAFIGSYKINFKTGFWESSEVLDQIFGIDKGYSRNVEGWLGLIHPDDRVLLNLYLDEEVIIKRNPFNREYRIIRKSDGETRWVSGMGKAEFDEKGNIMLMIGTIQDVTDRKLAENVITKLAEELEEKVIGRTAQLLLANKELEAFSYSASHDLRTPLRAMDGFANILLEDYSTFLDEEAKRMLHIIIDNTNRMGHLIDDLLSFSRLGRQEMECSAIDMHQMACSVYQELVPEPEHAKIELHIQNIPVAYGDPSMMRQLWMNLIGNAIKFSSRKLNCTVEVGCRTEGNENIFYVKDNGEGFDMIHSSNLFAVFKRLPSAREFDGNGVGLAIVKRIVLLLNGRIWAEGKVSEGATFYFALPAGQREMQTIEI